MNGEVEEVDVTEYLELRSLVEEDWEVAKHNLQGLGFEELRPQIAKRTSVIHLAEKAMTMLTASWINTRQAKKAGAIKDREGLPSARIANVI